MKNQIIIVIKQYNTLINIFKNTGFQSIEHSVGGIVKTTPVKKKCSEAVSTDGIVKKIVYIWSRPE